MSSKFPPSHAEASKTKGQGEPAAPPEPDDPVHDDPKPPDHLPEPEKPESDEQAAEVEGPLTKLAAEHPPAVAGPMEAPPGEPSAEALPTGEFPELKPIPKGQVGGFGIEALEAYRYGERNRYDQNGALWRFRREAVGNQFQLTIVVSLQGVLLAHGAAPLDRVASADGEHMMLKLVEDLAKASVEAGKAVKSRQQALAKEAAKAQA